MSSLSSLSAADIEQNLPRNPIDPSRNTMTTSNSTIEESNGKAYVDYTEDLERDSTAKAVDVANMERVKLTEEDVRSFIE